MTRQFSLPSKGQIDVDQFEGNKSLERSRQIFTLKAQKFAVEQGNRKVAYLPIKGEGVSFLAGASRVVAEALYALFVKSPEGSLSEAVSWAVNTAADLVPLGSVDLGSGREGPISPKSFTVAVEYFEQSIDWALGENRRAKSASANARAKEKWEASRRGGFQKVATRLTQTVGEVVSV